MLAAMFIFTRFVELVLLPPDDPAGAREEQQEGADQKPAIVAEEVVRPVAAQVFIHFAKEGFVDFGGRG